MNVLVTDAFSSANRGDAAILDGILTGLRVRLPRAAFRVTSRFPALTRRFHGVEALPDQDVVAVARAIDAADLVVGCGGSYLHDLYELNLHPRLATIHLAARAGKPFVVFAQSLGPLDSPLSRTAVRNALDGAAWVLARDPASERVVRALGTRAPVTLGVDAAVLGRVVHAPRGDRPRLGVTVRNWHFPGGADRRVLQDRYEGDVAAACDAWVERAGGEVVFLATCTPLGGYVHDDRVPARRVVARMRHPARVEEAEDLSFAEVRGQAGACDLFLGTRKHSLLFATTAGVPGVGVGYERKTAEWLAQVGLPGWSRPIEDTRGLPELVLRAWEEREALAARVAAALPGLRARAEAQLDQLAALAEGGRVRPAPIAAREGAGWDGETWRYDRPHRRLRAVVDTVLGEASGGRVLDLGSSTGLLGRMLGPRFDYTGLDAAPSVAVDEPGFRVRSTALDEAWPVDGLFDVVVASGSLEYVADLGVTLSRIRAALRPGGLAVLTLFNLAHQSRARGARRHPAWRFDARPDDFVLALRERGLAPTRVYAASAGTGPAPAVDAERDTDLDRSGATQLGLADLCRLAHHVVVVCRAGEPRPGVAEVERHFEAGDTLGALRLAVAVTRGDPWAARGWMDLGTLWHHAGDGRQALACLRRALALDPERPGLAEAVRALEGRETPVETGPGA